MLERKLLVGRYIDLVAPPPAYVHGGPVAGFREVQPIILRMNESESKGRVVQELPQHMVNQMTTSQKMAYNATLAKQKIGSQFTRQQTSTIEQGASAKLHRNFMWLPWIQGQVSEVASNHIDVLTGPMSGCWITSYMRNGLRYVGHIGTTLDPGQTAAAKLAWNTYIATQPPGTFAGYRPFNDLPRPAPPPETPYDSAAEVYALVTRYDFFSIVGYRQTVGTRFRIAEVHKMGSTLPFNGQI